MFLFFTFDATIIVAFIVLGVIVLGGSLKELAAFIVEDIHIVYPAFVGILAVFLLIYYIFKKSSIKKLSYSNSKKYLELSLNRKIIAFLINSPLVVLSPISAIQSLATYIYDNGVIKGLILALFMSLFFILAVYVILWLFLKAWEWAEEKESTFGTGKMLLVSLAFLVLQYILFIITQIK